MPRRIKRRRSLSLGCWLSMLAQLLILALLLSLMLVVPWRWFPLPTSSFMLQSYWFGDPAFQPNHYVWTNYEQIAPEMALAAIAAEDQRFPEHQGFDLTEIERAFEDYQQGESLRGASTISQQVAKNLYLWADQNVLRKGLEAWFTVLIEVLWSKQRILEVYLNVAQFGDHIFGVEAASQLFLGITANQLTADDAALLAAVLPAPELYQVDQPSGDVIRRQSWILQQMNQLGGTDYLQRLN